MVSRGSGEREGSGAGAEGKEVLALLAGAERWDFVSVQADLWTVLAWFPCDLALKVVPSPCTSCCFSKVMGLTLLLG